MADSFVSKLITELTAKTTVADTDLVPIADSNGNFFKMTWQKLKQLLLGTKDISGVGDGTVTGAISELNTNIHKINFDAIKNGITHGTYVDSDGIVCLCIGVTGNADCRINVSNKEVARLRWYGGAVSGTNVFPITFPVTNGSNITVSGLGDTASIANGYLIPYYNYGT